MYAKCSNNNNNNNKNNKNDNNNNINKKNNDNSDDNKNDDDSNLAPQQFLKNSPGIAWFQMMMIATLPHSNFKKIALAPHDFK